MNTIKTTVSSGYTTIWVPDNHTIIGVAPLSIDEGIEIVTDKSEMPIAGRNVNLYLSINHDVTLKNEEFEQLGIVSRLYFNIDSYIDTTYDRDKIKIKSNLTTTTEAIVVYIVSNI